MTRAACNLLLHLATVRQCWRSIQALRQPSQDVGSIQDSLESTNKDEDLHSASSSSTSTALLVRDVSLLHFWALLAFHAVYIQTGLERILSFVPFYYYIKLILILITVQPETGFARYWFETCLIPLMDHIHSMLDMDWKTFLRQEMILFPYTILHAILFPGLFTLDDISEDNEEEQQMEEELDDYNSILIHDEQFKDILVTNIQEDASDNVVPSYSTPSIQKKYRFSLESAPFRDETSRYDRAHESRDESDIQRPSSHSKLSEKIREFVVGDKTIRLRDYLFDLNLKTLPSPIPNGKKTSSPHSMNSRPWSKLNNRNMNNGFMASPEPERPKFRSKRHVDPDENQSVQFRRSRRIASLNQNKNI